ncbi:MAG: hypothetical protein K0Q55_2872 [Verrucomicrobia bacterium]|jgi:hypothetical protein|nr:hypothetical protein [Verrucomicrobiota bacterium]
MPIKINLLAEEQATEELRRKDPVKRAIIAAVALVVLMLVWVGLNWISLMGVNKKFAEVNAMADELKKPKELAEANQKLIRENQYKMEMLKKMSAVRPLWAPVLDTLQRSIVDDVQILRIKADQIYQVTPAFVPPRGSTLKPKPAVSKQIITMTIEAQDNSERLDSYNRLRETLATALKDHLGTNGTVSLKTLNQARENEQGKKYLTFSLECGFTEVVR